MYKYNPEELTKKLEENAKVLEVMINDFVKDEDRKNALFKMLEETSDLFLMSPGSSAEKYHDAYYGGLFDHSINVFENLVKANKTWDLGFSTESMFVSALLHDFGKAMTPDLKSPHYTETEEWMKKRGINFEADFSKGYFTNRDRTMYVLQHFGVKLSAEEYQAVLLNDGIILDANKAYAMKEYDLAFWLQVADNWAARQQKS